MERFKFYLDDIDDNSRYKLKHGCGGWEEYGVNFGRETDISNVVKGYSDGWTFYKEDADWIKDRFYSYGPNRRLRLTVMETTNMMTEESKVAYRGYLDLSQIAITSTSVNIPTGENGFFKSLENKWGQEYDYDYDSFCKIDGNVFSEKASFTSPDETSSTLSSDKIELFFMAGGELANTDTISDTFFQTTNLQLCYVKNISGGSNYTQVGTQNMFLLAKDVDEVQSLKIKLKFDLRIDITNLRGSEISTEGSTTLESNMYVWLVSFPYDKLRDNPPIIDIYGGVQSGLRFQLLGKYKATTTYQRSIINSVDYGKVISGGELENTFSNIDTNDDSGCGFMVLFDFRIREKYNAANRFDMYGVTLENGASVSARFNQFQMESTFEMRINTNKMVSCISSVDVFRKLIDSINGGTYNVVCDTSGFEDKVQDDVLTSGSGMKRKLSMTGANRDFIVCGNITTSLQTYLEYCSAIYNYRMCVDYDLQTDTYRVYLAHYDKTFSNERIALLSAVGDIQMNVCRDYLYTRIVVGYETDDDMINPEREFNCELVFNTPNTEVEESELQIVSPYDAASRDFETDLYKNFESDDDGNDKVYVLNVQKVKYINGTSVSYNYVLRRTISVEGGSSFGAYEWNLKYSPKRMLNAHLRELSSYLAFNAGDYMTFSSGDHNVDITSDGIEEKADLQISSERLFMPLEMSVESAGDSDLIEYIEQRRLGYFEFKYYGNTVRGYISKDNSAVSIKPMKEGASTFKLLLSADSFYKL